MAKTKKKPTVKKTAAKKPAKKVVNKVIKKAGNKVIKKPLIKSPKVLRAAQGKEMFGAEIKMLDMVQTDLFEAITSKPDARDYEAIRLYVDNMYMVLNKTVTIIMDVKNLIIKKDVQELITETYNPPA